MPENKDALPAQAEPWTMTDKPQSLKAAEKIRGFLDLCEFRGRTVSWPTDEWREAATPDNLRALLAEHDDALAIIEQLQAENARLKADADRLDFLADEYIDVSSFDMPTGAGDADVGWKLTQEHMGKKGVVILHEHYRDDLRAAIDAAMQAQKESGR